MLFNNNNKDERTLMSGCVSMNSPRDGSSVKPLTPFPLLNTSWREVCYTCNVTCRWLCIKLYSIIVYRAGTSIHTIPSCYHIFSWLQYIIEGDIIRIVYHVNSKDLHGKHNIRGRNWVFIFSYQVQVWSYRSYGDPTIDVGRSIQRVENNTVPNYDSTITYHRHLESWSIWYHIWIKYCVYELNIQLYTLCFNLVIWCNRLD